MKGSWWPTELKFKSRAQEPFLKKGFLYKLSSSPKFPLHTSLPTCPVFLPSEPTLIKEFLESYFIQQEWDFPHPIWAISPLAIFTNQSEWLHFDHLKECFLDQTVKIWSPHLHEDGPIRDQRQGLLSI